MTADIDAAVAKDLDPRGSTSGIIEKRDQTAVPKVFARGAVGDKRSVAGARSGAKDCLPAIGRRLKSEESCAGIIDDRRVFGG